MIRALVIPAAGAPYIGMIPDGPEAQLDAMRKVTSEYLDTAALDDRTVMFMAEQEEGQESGLRLNVLAALMFMRFGVQPAPLVGGVAVVGRRGPELANVGKHFEAWLEDGPHGPLRVISRLAV